MLQSAGRGLYTLYVVTNQMIWEHVINSQE